MACEGDRGKTKSAVAVETVVMAVVVGRRSDFSLATPRRNVNSSNWII